MNNDIQAPTFYLEKQLEPLNATGGIAFSSDKRIDPETLKSSFLLVLQHFPGILGLSEVTQNEVAIDVRTSSSAK